MIFKRGNNLWKGKMQQDKTLDEGTQIMQIISHEF